MSLTSPLIDQALSQLCAFCSPELAKGKRKLVLGHCPYVTRQGRRLEPSISFPTIQFSLEPYVEPYCRAE
jgi:hypothetical protein